MGSRTFIISAGAFALLLGACGGIPPSGAPMDAAPASDDDPPPHVTGTRLGPQQGAEPSEIVAGFIAAMEIYERSPRGYPTAMEFLTQEAASDWEPLSEIVIYDDDPLVSVDGDVATVTVRVEATYDRTDGYRRNPDSGDPVSFTFDLERVDEEWRLAQAPDGLLIQENAFNNDFQAYNLYFYNPAFDGSAMVPDPVYLPRSASNLETLLVRELLAGPSEWLAPAVKTAFPANTTLEPEAVPVNNGDADVSLGRAVLHDEDGAVTSPEDRQRMVDQLVRTLSEQRTVDRVSVTGPDGTPLSGTNEDPYVSVADSSSPGLADRLYTVTESGVAWLVEGSSPAAVTPITGPLGDYPGLQEVAVDGSHQTAAAVTENGELVFADLDSESELREYPAGGAFGSLAWDSSGLLWAIERTPGGGEDGEAGNPSESEEGQSEDGQAQQGDVGNRVLVIDPATNDVQAVTPPTPGRAEVEQLAIAPDGTRIAFVAGGRVFEAVVVRERSQSDEVETVDVTGVRGLNIEGVTESVGDVDWEGTDKLALLTAPEAPAGEQAEPGSPDGQKVDSPKAHVVALSELAVDSTREVEDGVSVAAPSAGNRLAVGTSGGVVWMRSPTDRWVPLEDAMSPAFSG